MKTELFQNSVQAGEICRETPALCLCVMSLLFICLFIYAILKLMLKTLIRKGVFENDDVSNYD